MRRPYEGQARCVRLASPHKFLSFAAAQSTTSPSWPMTISRLPTIQARCLLQGMSDTPDTYRLVGLPDGYLRQNTLYIVIGMGMGNPCGYSHGYAMGMGMGRANVTHDPCVPITISGCTLSHIDKCSKSRQSPITFKLVFSKTEPSYRIPHSCCSYSNSTSTLPG